jgi:DNA-binding CsgD family transcriptional regulator
MRLGGSDYRAALDFLKIAQGVDGPEPFPERVVDALRRLIPCAIVSYREWGEDGAFRQWVSGVDADSVQPIWSRYIRFRDQDPLPGGPSFAGGGCPTLGSALKFSDFLTLKQLKRLDLHAEVCRPLGINYVMKLFLPATGGGAGFVLDSERRDFGERDRLLLELLSPHLRVLRRAALARTPLGRESEAFATLTPRERQVVRLLATGMTNREIAAALYIATGTVRKHLDNIYAKLEVQTRTAAARHCRT